MYIGTHTSVCPCDDYVYVFIYAGYRILRALGALLQPHIRHHILLHVCVSSYFYMCMQVTVSSEYWAACCNDTYDPATAGPLRLGDVGEVIQVRKNGGKPQKKRILKTNSASATLARIYTYV